MNNYAETIKEILEEEGIEVKVTTVTKNNGVQLIGITKAGEGACVCPTVYAEHFKECGMSPEEAAEKIKEIFEAPSPTIDIEAIMSKENILENVFPRLVSEERNEVLKAEHPWKKVENTDLMYVYYISVNMDETEGSILLNNQMLEKSNITVEELDKSARENLAKDGCIIKTMYDMLLGLMPEIEAEEEIAECGMFVITNESSHYGATQILKDETLEEIKEKIGEDFYILPSSIHELICLPVSLNEDIAPLYDMVYDVNRTQVAENEVLSDSVYLYKDGKLQMAV